MLRRTSILSMLAGMLLLPGLSLWAQQPPARQQPEQPSAKEIAKEAARPFRPRNPNDPIERIKDEGLNRSQVMQTLSYLTDVIGPRLTASPQMKQANEWTRDKLAEWGLQDAHLEAWGPFGRGWSLQRFSAQVVEPQCIPLIAYPKAWSCGTDGPIVAEVVHLDAQKESDLEAYKGRLRGKIVLIGPVREVQAHFESLGARLGEKELLRLADAPDPQDRNLAFPMMGRPRGPRRGGDLLFLRRKLQFAIDEGAAALVDSSLRGDGGTLFVAAAAIPQATSSRARRRIAPWDKDAPATPPQLVVANEHYNRMVRMLKQGVKLRMELDLAVTFHDGDLMGYNTLAEIPGTDLKDEVVMLGGHMDSWHAGTGATDNGAGVAVAMEAVRILQALQLTPRRTIRIALWSGEEQGLLGSRAYVKEHFGGRDDDQAAPVLAAYASIFGAEPPRAELKTKPDYETFCAYFNLDNGTGKIRGVYLEGNEAVRPIFRRWLYPFREMGAETLSISRTGGTDHMSFDAIGLPGFQFIQDPIEYETRTHHSNQDVYDRIQADDLKQAAVILAAFVYNSA
ncbi:MAG: M20/M25/M40 family metallo-hydrolase, partial [Isosphaeraceae bacterium]|nr:M20/M25/M40 family metallo-hydrolase [Isosphaeraceae bacterium]